MLEVQIDENQLLELQLHLCLTRAAASFGISVQQRLLVQLQRQVLALVIGLQLQMLPLTEQGRQHRLPNIAQHGLIFIHKLPEIPLILDQTELMPALGLQQRTELRFVIQKTEVNKI